MTKEQFETFYSSLKKINAISENGSGLEKSQELKDVISGIQSIREDQYNRLFELGMRKEDLEKDLEAFFKPVFSPSQTSQLADLKSMTGDFFYIRKSFQLSHLDKVHRNSFKNANEFSDYFYLQLFTDYFETLTNRIRGISIAFHQFPNDYAKGPSFLLYENLKSEKLLPSLEEIMLEESLRHFRNDISHGQFICDQKSIMSIVDPKNAVLIQKQTEISKSKRRIYFSNVRALIVYHILFSTEFDLRFFQLPLSHSSIDMELWQEYYHLYLNSWITQQEITNQASAHS